MEYFRPFKRRRPVSAGKLSEITDHLSNDRRLDYSYADPTYPLSDAANVIYAMVVDSEDNKHAWQEQQFNIDTNDWEDKTDGDQGTLDNDPAYLPADPSQYIPNDVLIQVYTVGEVKILKLPAPMRCLITEVHKDWLVCKLEDGEDTFEVAKPPLLRGSQTGRTDLNGSVTFTWTDTKGYQTRTASNGTDTEAQYLLPGYAVDDVIFAFGSGTGSSGAFNDDDDEIYLIDLNADGRYWAADPPVTTP